MTKIVLKNSNVASKRPNPANLLDGEVALNINANSPGVFFKDSNGALVKAGPCAIGATAPNSTVPSGGFAGNSKGELWVDNSNPDTYILKVFNGTQWVGTYPAVPTLIGLTTGATTSLGVGAKQTVSSTVFVGSGAGSQISSGETGGVCIGSNANGGLNTVSVGSGAGQNTNSCQDSVLVGYQAGQNATGVAKVFVGTQAGQGATSGSQQTGVGYQALKSCTGSDNSGFGYTALTALTSGKNNCGFGSKSLAKITTGSNNTAMGFAAGFELTGAASNNIIIGDTAGPSGAASGNVCLGNLAGNGVTGNNNIFIGNNCSAGSNTTGSTLIGAIPSSIGNLTDQIILADNNGNIRLRFNQSGAMSFDGTNYGAAGAVLQSQGSGAPPRWTVGATGEFVTHDGRTVTVENGLVSSVI